MDHSDDRAARIESHLNRFEDEWHPDIDLIEFVPPDYDIRQEVFYELVQTDLELRVRAGQRARVEDYVDRFPDIEADRSRFVELIFWEQHVRGRREPGLREQEFIDRFPNDYVQVELRRVGAYQGESPSRVDDGSFGGRTGLAGRYRLLELYREGGLGKIYRAFDDELQRTVAIKEIRKSAWADPVVCQRFQKEATITAGLQHPGIVPVYGVGDYADGRPYYAMRLVEGSSLQDVIDEFFSGDQEQCSIDSLRMRRLLSRFVEVCNTLEYAHQSGVIHRDIKPANIVIGDFGETVVVDWGLAKRTNGQIKGNDESSTINSQDTTSQDTLVDGAMFETRDGQALGSPAFMSPEQARASNSALDERTDIYGLGAVLFTMLTGVPPIEGRRPADAIRKLVQGDIRSPRSLRASIPPELDAICMKAMAFSPEDRYASARQIAEDIERYLADEPVSARSESVGEKVQRWSRKNATLLRSAAVVLAVVSIAATATAIGIRRQKNVALAAEKRATHSHEFLMDAFRSPDPSLPGKDIKVYEMLEGSVEKLDANSELEPELKLDLYETCRKTLSNLGVAELTVHCCHQIESLSRELFGETHRRTLEARLETVETLVENGETQGIENLIEPIVQTATTQFGADDPFTLRARIARGRLQRALGNLATAEKEIGDVLDRQRLLLGDTHEDVLSSQSAMVQLQYEQDNFVDAIEGWESLLKHLESTRGTDHPTTIRVLSSLADAYRNTRQFEKSHRLMSMALDRTIRSLGRNHSVTSNVLHNWALSEMNSGNIDEAIRCYEECIAIRKEIYSPGNTNTLATIHNLGSLYMRIRKNERAAELLREAWEGRILVLGKSHKQTVSSLSNLAVVVGRIGDSQEALELHLEALKRMDDNPEYERDDDYRMMTMVNLANCYNLCGQHDESARLWEEFTRLADAKKGVNGAPESFYLPRNAHAQLLAGNFERALALAQRWLDSLEKVDDPNPEQLADATFYRGAAELELDQVAKAESTLSAALDLFAQSTERNFNEYVAMGLLGQSHRRQGDLSSAREMLESAVQGLRSMDETNIRDVERYRVEQVAGYLDELLEELNPNQERHREDVINEQTETDSGD